MASGLCLNLRASSAVTEACLDKMSSTSVTDVDSGSSSDLVSEFEPEPSLLHATSSSSAEDDSSDEVGSSALRRQVEPYLLTFPVQSAAACLSCFACYSSSSFRCSDRSGNRKFTGCGSYISRSIRRGLRFTRSSFSAKTCMTRGGATCRWRGLFHSPLANQAKIILLCIKECCHVITASS